MSGAPERDPDPYLLRTVRDGAHPLAQALHAVYDGPRGPFHVHKVTVAYSDDGILVSVDPGLDQATHDLILKHFETAFGAAGWGWSAGHEGTGANFRWTDIRFRHPSTMRRTG